AEVLAPLLRNDGPIGPDSVEENVAVLLLHVPVANDDVLEPVEVMASAPQVLVGEAGHLIVRQRPLVAGETHGHVLDWLRDVGPLLPDRLELSGQLRARSAGHVACDDLGLVLWAQAVAFVEDVACGASEAGASGDLGDHGSSPSARVIPKSSPRTVPSRHVSSSTASTTSAVPAARRRSAQLRAMVFRSAATRPRAWYVSRLTSGIGRTARRGGSGRARTTWRMYVDTLIPRSRATSASWSRSASVRRTGTIALRRWADRRSEAWGSGFSSGSKSVRDMVQGITQLGCKRGPNPAEVSKKEQLETA